MNNYIFDVNEIVYIPNVDMYGKIIHCQVIENNTTYMIVFDDGTWDTFYGFELNREEF